MMHTLSTELFDEICKIPCVNSHSHIMPEEERLREPLDALTFFRRSYYTLADLISVGMSESQSEAAFTDKLPLEERFRIFEPYWRWIRLTGFSQCIMEGFRDLLGFSELTQETIGPISEALYAYNRPGFYHEILKRQSNITVSVLNLENHAVQANGVFCLRGIEIDRELFLPLPRLNRFSTLQSADQIHAIEEDYNINITNLGEHLEAIQEVCHGWKDVKVAGVKLSQSYHRSMDFKHRQKATAAKIFDKLLKGSHIEVESGEGVFLEDYLVFECCRAAAEAGLTIQFHQGMRAGNYQRMEGCSPAALAELLGTFPNARFDLSHSGYPYLREGAVLGKGFPNVYLNMSWIHIISPVGSRMDLKEWLRMVPYNKIIAYGDDLKHVEAVYGHLKMARQNFAIALADMIEEKVISESIALDVAHAVFHDNPSKLYGLE